MPREVENEGVGIIKIEAKSEKKMKMTIFFMAHLHKKIDCIAIDGVE